MQVIILQDFNRILPSNFKAIHRDYSTAFEGKCLGSSDPGSGLRV